MNGFIRLGAIIDLIAIFLIGFGWVNDVTFSGSFTGWLLVFYPLVAAIGRMWNALFMEAE